MFKLQPKNTISTPARDAMSIAEEMDRKMYNYMLVAVAGRLALADGDMNSQEVLAFFDEFSIPKHERKEMVALLRNVRYDTLELGYYVNRIKSMYPNALARYRSIVRKCFTVAKVDGALKVAELKFLRMLCSAFGLMESDYLQLVRAEMMPSHANPYKTLGVNRLTGKKELKSTYKKALCQYHPDMFSGHDWAHDIAVVATARNAQLSQAFHAIHG